MTIVYKPKSKALCSTARAVSTAFFQLDSLRYFSISDSVLKFFDFEDILFETGSRRTF